MNRGHHLLNVLHLTDLHLSPTDKFDETLIRDALIEDLSKLKATLQAPDIVVFTGDLAKAAGDDAAYDAVAGYLRQVLSALGLDETRMFICPGNHDANRAVVADRVGDIATWRTSASSTKGANQLIENEHFKDYARQAFARFTFLEAQFGSAFLTRQASPFSNTYYVSDLGVAIVAMNTATLSGAGLKEVGADDRTLCTSESAVVAALRSAPDDVPIILLGNPSEFRECGDRLKRPRAPWLLSTAPRPQRPRHRLRIGLDHP